MAIQKKYIIMFVAGLLALMALAVWLSMRITKQESGLSGDLGGANAGSFTPPAHEIIVANHGGDSIVGFEILANGSVAATPARVIWGNNTGVDDPIDLAVDSSGNIYVLNQGLSGGNPTITVFASDANGNVSPTRTITANSLQKPQGIAVRTQGGGNQAIWVANWVDQPTPANTSGVLQFSLTPPATNPPFRLFATSVPPTGISHRPPSGSLFVPLRQANSIVVLPSDASFQLTMPGTTITGPSTLLDEPVRTATDATSTLYVVNAGDQSITIYDQLVVTSVPPLLDAAPTRRLQAGPAYHLADPYGIAVSEAGRIFVTDGNRLLVLDRTANSGVAFGQEIISVPVSGFAVVLESLNAPIGVAVRCSPPGCPAP